jgi:WD40 repeat protein
MIQKAPKRKFEEEKIELNLRGKVFVAYLKDLRTGQGTYFDILTRSYVIDGETYEEIPVWKPDYKGTYFIDTFSEGFDRVLLYLKTGILRLKCLNEYEVYCVYKNLDYFNIPHLRRCEYVKHSKYTEGMENFVLQLYNDYVCGLGDDGKLVFIDDDSRKIEYTLEKHISENGYTSPIIAAIQLQDGRVCTCYADGYINIWEREFMYVDVCIYADRYSDSVVQLRDGNLCCKSEDGFEFWSEKNGNSNFTIYHDFNSTSNIVQLKSRDGHICCGLSDGNINIWEIRMSMRAPCKTTLIGHTGLVSGLAVIDHARMCSCSFDESIRVWNISTAQCEKVLVGHDGYVTHILLLRDGRLCSASNDGVLKLWDIKEAECVLTMDPLPEGWDDYRPSSRKKLLQLYDDDKIVFSSYSWNLLVVL